MNDSSPQDIGSDGKQRKPHNLLWLLFSIIPVPAAFLLSYISDSDNGLPHFLILNAVLSFIAASRLTVTTSTVEQHRYVVAAVLCLAFFIANIMILILTGFLLFLFFFRPHGC